MKRLIFSAILLFVAGCAEMTPYQRHTWSNSLINIAEKMDRSSRQVEVVYPQSQNSTYWQEKNARDEWWDRHFMQPYKAPKY